MNLLWKVSVTKLSDLQKTLNAFERSKYEVDRYEKVSDTYDGPEWAVFGWKLWDAGVMGKCDYALDVLKAEKDLLESNIALYNNSDVVECCKNEDAECLDMWSRRVEELEIAIEQLEGVFN